MDGNKPAPDAAVLFRRTISIENRAASFLRLETVAFARIKKLRVTLLDELSLEFFLGTRAMLSGDIGLSATPINWNQPLGCICLEVSDHRRTNIVTYVVYHDCVKASEQERLDLEGGYLGAWDPATLKRDAAERIRLAREQAEIAIAKYLRRLGQ